MATKAELTERNRAIFKEVVQALFIDQDVDRFGSFVSDEEYIQHNPLIADGKAPVMAFLKRIMAGGGPAPRILNTIVDGDIGVVHAETQMGGRTMLIVDMFRIKDGKLVEHWDVLSPPPVLG